MWPDQDVGPVRRRRNPVIGVLGGMGPAATADFYTKLVGLTDADNDQDHPKVIVWSDPTVPDRTAALLGHGPDPTPWIARGIRKLQRAGASVVAMPCNTAHAFLPRITDPIDVPVIHMIRAVATYLVSQRPELTTVGLLATTGTVHARLYQDCLGPAGIETVVPEPAVQRDHVMRAIESLKRGDRGPGITSSLAYTVEGLMVRGAQAVIAGCTEIPLGLTAEQSPCPVVDSATVLARAALACVGSAPRTWRTSSDAAISRT